MDTTETKQNYLYNGKERQTDLDLDWYDYGARMYDAAIGRWHVVDALAENSISMTQYHFVSNNPIIFVDPNGLDWFYYKAEGEDDATYHWQDGSTYEHTYSYTDENGEEQTSTMELEGTETAILFEGSEDESLSDDGKLTGEDANPANVTVFGPKGKDDVQTYRGLTVSSNPEKYSMLAEGQFTANYSPMATSLYGDNERTKKRGIPGALTYSLSQNGKTTLPVEGGINKLTKLSFMSDVFIHRTNWSGKADKASRGCLLIDGRQYRRFEKQLGKAMSISVTLRRKK